MIHMDSAVQEVLDFINNNNEQYRGRDSSQDPGIIINQVSRLFWYKQQFQFIRD